MDSRSQTLSVSLADSDEDVKRMRRSRSKTLSVGDDLENALVVNEDVVNEDVNENNDVVSRRFSGRILRSTGLRKRPMSPLRTITQRDKADVEISKFPMGFECDAEIPAGSNPLRKCREEDADKEYEDDDMEDKDEEDEKKKENEDKGLEDVAADTQDVAAQERTDEIGDTINQDDPMSGDDTRDEGQSEPPASVTEEGQSRTLRSSRGPLVLLGGFYVKFVDNLYGRYH